MKWNEMKYGTKPKFSRVYFHANLRQEAKNRTENYAQHKEIQKLVLKNIYMKTLF